MNGGKSGFSLISAKLIDKTVPFQVEKDLNDTMGHLFEAYVFPCSCLGFTASLNKNPC